MSDLVGNPEDRFSRVTAHLGWNRMKFVNKTQVISSNKTISCGGHAGK